MKLKISLKRKVGKQDSSLNMPALLSSLMVPILTVMLLVSCDISDFGDMNVDPTASTEMEDRFQISTVQLGYTSNWQNAQKVKLRYASAIAQQTAHVVDAVGDHYRLNPEKATRLWRNQYNQSWMSVRNVQDIIHKLGELQAEGEQVDNRLAVARIMRVFKFQRLTDVYGDLPYFEGGKGLVMGVTEPRYDPQQEVYNDMLNELAEAVAQFDPGQSTYGSADLVYGGDIGKWQRFGNSLRLRLAMRLVKVDPDRAREEAEAAVNAPGGVMTSNDDIWLMQHHSGPGTSPHENPIAEHYSRDGGIYISQTMVNWMQDREDPRLRIYGAVVKGDEVITDLEQQLGRPNGYPSSSELEAHPSWTGDVTDYTKLHPRFLDVENPSIWFTWAEVEFLQAEMEVRWGSSPLGAEEHYNNGVRAAMTYLANYSGDTDISDTEIDDYLLNNPFNIAGSGNEQLEQINEQYWAAVYMNGYEAWQNWKRTGYPALEPSPVDSPDPHPLSDTGGEPPRRLIYDPNEAVLNAANYEEVINRQGPDLLTTRMWWDVAN